MADRLIEIKIAKAVLFLTERELLDNLPRELLKMALQRGKGITRRRQYEARLEQMQGESNLNKL